MNFFIFALVVSSDEDFAATRITRNINFRIVEQTDIFTGDMYGAAGLSRIIARSIQGSRVCHHPGVATHEKNFSIFFNCGMSFYDPCIINNILDNISGIPCRENYASAIGLDKSGILHPMVNDIAFIVQNIAIHRFGDREVDQAISDKVHRSRFTRRHSYRPQICNDGSCVFHTRRQQADIGCLNETAVDYRRKWAGSVLSEIIVTGKEVFVFDTQSGCQ